ncbi:MULTISPECIES: hypothetical protein [Calothrix]|uniref:Uncharacterized protein n=2 Tax=Calothrix TaxID=1186 RepID=A0ABR8AH42_9CYAN|nr:MULTISPECIES: hypothetical protein [Calothrix]MBD2199259.1 hypothetical protein [Calothrix parietina FACHB-288]MBD2227961.1 hypothetical protein [Calothrix anomala FACHB-343]
MKTQHYSDFQPNEVLISLVLLLLMFLLGTVWWNGVSRKPEHFTPRTVPFEIALYQMFA